MRAAQRNGQLQSSRHRPLQLDRRRRRCHHRDPPVGPKRLIHVIVYSLASITLLYDPDLPVYYLRWNDSFMLGKDPLHLFYVYVCAESGCGGMRSDDDDSRAPDLETCFSK